MKREIKLHAYVFFITLLALIASYAVISFQVGEFNNTVFTDNLGSENRISKDIALEVRQRGGSSGKWTRDITSKIKKDHNNQLTGEIYDVVITNNAMYGITDWELKVNVTTDCYINSAWCGTVEIHQFSDGIENVQTVDLREWQKQELTLEYYLDAADILIPLHKGDFLVYYPSADANEKSLETTRKNSTANLTVGYIVYYNEDEVTSPYNFGDMEISYHLKEELSNLIQFDITVALSVIWVLAMIIVSVGDIRFYRYSKVQVKDREKINQILMQLADYVDRRNNTPKHSLKVANITWALAHRMGFLDEECREFYYAALLHDVGKMEVPEYILLKKGRLTDDEFEAIKRHTTQGAEHIDGASAFPYLKDAVMYHHERYDGTGYPTGLSGDNIPMVARIIAVANACDAMSNARNYRGGLPEQSVVDELEKNKGTQFDPEIVDLMIRLIYDTDYDESFFERINK